MGMRVSTDCLSSEINIDTRFNFLLASPVGPSPSVEVGLVLLIVNLNTSEVT